MEIILTRPATRIELQRACRVVPLAANAGRTHLMIVCRAKSPGQALRSLRHELDRLLPIDVLTTHYPDATGRVLLNVALTRAMRAAISQAAADRGQKPGDFLGRTVVTALERDERDRTRQVTAQLQGLLIHHSPEDVLACAAHVLLERRHPASTPAAYDANGC
ncbi:hypothetical protein ACIGZH_38375 [Streptomyces sp. NPDC058319]|uniref:hypothetical protein n=1 Tax=unclassified Streptomyces TaxID=2593676 RepID=UPI0036E564F9